MKLSSDTTGPSSTYGCACADDSASLCALYRHGNRDESCECLCHRWREQDAEEGPESLADIVRRERERSRWKPNPRYEWHLRAEQAAQEGEGNGN